MKTFILPTVAAFLFFAQCSQAAPSQPTSGSYVSLNVLSTDVSFTGLAGMLGDLSNNGYSIAFGYDDKESDSFLFGMEAEFLNYGSDDKSLSDKINHHLHELSALAFNLKPKYFFNRRLYLGAMVGLAIFGGELSTEKSSSNDNDWAAHLGMEMGYVFNKHWQMKAGYQVAPSVSIDDITFEVETLFAGLNYKF